MKRISQRGQILPLIAVCLVCILGFAGIAVDVGFLEYRQQAQQTATDAAAIGGAQSLAGGSCSNASASVTAAQNDAASNSFTNGGNITVYATSPPSAGPYAGDTCAMYVSINTLHVQTFFSRLFGYPNGMTETTQAVARASSSGNGCIYVLNPTVTFQLNGTLVSAPSCGILSNAPVQSNGGTVGVSYFGYAATYQNNSTTFTGASPSPMLPVADPCPHILGCAYYAANPPSTSSCSAYQENGVNGAVMTPGCYSSVQFNGGSVTMRPGQYTFTGTVQDNGVPVVGNGVTMYATASAGPILFNGSNDTFSPPTTGNWAGVLYYQVPSNHQVVQFNGSSGNLAGLIYAPGALGQVNGASGAYVVLVFGNLQLNGGYTLSTGSPSPDQSIIKKAVLSQ